ncbi:DUF4126 domain-containing protein [Sphingobacterium sp. SYP-B4668]|uniref:DUF4126 domain-containing protein n=1 Tax=Sphingobacterium sp. SYP-B4668 TaxID=2996035 RepID=UPI0022DDDCFD|nr:DUF4126 domain-containing protein [Sphingobacterium sp. SYP-B4668]
MDISSFSPYIISTCIGIGLAAATGFRVFLPFFLLSMASFFDWVPLNTEWSWLASLPTLIITGVATIVEILGYYIPFIDNILDTINIPLATLAGSLLFASQFADMSALPQWALAIIAGGGTAAVIGSGFAGTRATSSATTGGFGNFIVSTIETAGAIVLSILALFAPILGFILAITMCILMIRYGRRLWKRYHHT